MSILFEIGNFDRQVQGVLGKRNQARRRESTCQGRLMCHYVITVVMSLLFFRYSVLVFRFASFSSGKRAYITYKR